MHEGSRQSACLCFSARFGHKTDVLDPKGKFQRAPGRTIRAGIDIPDGDTTPERRRDVAVIFKDLPEPIDLELDLANRTIGPIGGSTALETRSIRHRWM